MKEFIAVCNLLGVQISMAEAQALFRRCAWAGSTRLLCAVYKRMPGVLACIYHNLSSDLMLLFVCA